MEIREMLPLHWEDVKNIYAEGIATGFSTFETSVPSWDQWNAAHIMAARLVAVENEKILGWAAISPVSGRCVYAGAGEVSVYVSAAARGRGIGRELLNALVHESELAGIWTLQAGIFPENNASVKIHEHAGFRLIGRREKIGKLGNLWMDTLLFEKRSKLPEFD